MDSQRTGGTAVSRCNAPREINFHSSIFDRQSGGRMAGQRTEHNSSPSARSLEVNLIRQVAVTLAAGLWDFIIPHPLRGGTSKTKMLIIGEPLHVIVPKVLRTLSLFDHTSSGPAMVMGRKSQYVTKSFIHVTRLVLPSWDITVASISGISLQR